MKHVKSNKHSTFTSASRLIEALDASKKIIIYDAAGKPRVVHPNDPVHKSLKANISNYGWQMRGHIID